MNKEVLFHIDENGNFLKIGEIERLEPISPNICSTSNDKNIELNNKKEESIETKLLIATNLIALTNILESS